jgi:hypothetical protein
MRGYLSTLRKQGLALLNALEQALAGHPPKIRPLPSQRRL